MAYRPGTGNQDNWDCANKRWRRKLTPTQRYEIQQRRWAGEDPKDLSLEFKVSASYVRSLAPLGGSRG